jgi:uncharacterized protein
MVRKMSSPLFIDTGYIIALINANDLYHQQALTWADRYDRHPVLTTDAVLLEVGNALSRFARQEATDVIQYFQTASEATVISLTPELFNSAIDLYAKYQDKTWGLVDCLSFVVMTEQQISTALSFDRHFIQAGFSLAPFSDDRQSNR